MLTIVIPESEQYDPVKNEFYTVKKEVLNLEHSLLSVAKWESKWHKPYLSKEEKTEEELFDYIRCMAVSQNVDPKVFYSLTADDLKRIFDYIGDPMTATTFSNQKQTRSREIITNELIYYWMVALNIPFEPCQKWHLNRLLTLIEVCSIKNQPPKKMSSKELAKRNSSLNAARRAKYGTRG